MAAATGAARPTVDEVEKRHHDAIAAHQDAAAELSRLTSLAESGAAVEPDALTEAGARVEHAALRIEAARRALVRARTAARVDPEPEAANEYGV